MANARGFLSYAHEDWETAERLHGDLLKRGHHVWFDRAHFRADESVDAQVLNAIRESTYFVLLLTSVSVSKDGYIRKEIRLALDMIREFNLSTAFVIPVRSESCEPQNDELGGLSQFIDLFDDWNLGVDNISRAIPASATTDLLREGPLAIHSALCDFSYLKEMSLSLLNHPSIGVTIDNLLSRLRGIDGLIMSRKITSMRNHLSDFKECLAVHFVHHCGERDPRTRCCDCGAVGTIIHGDIDISPSMDEFNNYIALCENCFWSWHKGSFDMWGNNDKLMSFSYETNTYR